MALVAYASSDDGSEEEQDPQAQLSAEKQAAPPIAPSNASKADNEGPQEKSTIHQPQRQSEPERQPANPKQETMTIGPIRQSAVPLGPSLPSMDDPMPEGNDDDETQLPQAPSSPYSANRAAIQDLTLPTIPNLDIPPSPPGSPPPGANKKFEQFLDLKKKGTHFNSKLEQSTALRNPSLMDKLMAFVEVDGGARQYETTLSTDLWDPSAFPKWAYRDKLRKSREKVAKEKEAERAAGGRTSIDFVPSTVPSSDSGIAPGEGTVGRGSERRKGGWK